MKSNKLLTFILTLLLILNVGTAFAAIDTNSPDYKAGYEAGREVGSDNFGDDITAAEAFSDYDYPDGIVNFTAFREGFYIGYEEGITGAPTKTNYADVLGTSLGGIYGTRDFQQGTKSNWNNALPSDRTIRSMFNLDMETSNYRDLFLDSFKIKFQESYLNAYEKAMLEPARTTLTQGIADGEELGGLLGAVYGAKDYYENRDINFTRDMPSDRVITTEYSLNNDLGEYKKGFLSGFIRAYEENYNKTFREANLNNTLRDEKDAYTNGQAIGSKNGGMKAIEDFMSKLTNDWKRSLPNERFLIVEYSLIYQSSNYRDGFISGFFDGYSEGYNSKFKELAQGAGVDKSISTIIPIKGGSLLSLDSAFLVSIKQGTYYHPVNLTTHTTYDVGQPAASSLIKSSDSYKVSILNTSNNLVDTNLIEISFEYYGDKLRGGIYKLVDNNWMYIPTIIEDGVIKSFVKPSGINNTYSVFVDTKALIFPDARGHWAKDEITTYIRRGVIYGYTDMTFKPERNISRAEFLTLLSRIYNWSLPTYTSNTTTLKDYGTFGNRNGIISYALSAGYIKGYPDGTFKPNDPISYKEIEIIMGRVFGNPYFKWSDTSAKMLYEEKVRSTSIDNMNNKITRAEVVYMLYNTTESRN